MEEKEKDTEKKNAKDNYLNKNSTKNGILSVIGAITHKLGISSIWVISNLATYVISYHRRNDLSNDFLSLNLSYFFNPILVTTLNIFMPICGILEFKLGCQRAIILGALVIMLGYGLLYISPSIFLDFFGIFLFGIGLSISTTLSTKNAIQYFFNQRGAISGILELISSGLSATHNKIAESMINPDGEEPSPIEGSDDEFYSEPVSEKVLNFFILELGTYGISTLLTLFFLVPYDEKAAKKLSKELKKKALEKSKEENNAINENEDENKKEEENPLIVKDYNRNTVNNALLPDSENEENLKIYEVSEGQKEDDYDAKLADGQNKNNQKVIAIPDTKAGALETNPVSGNISMSVSQVNYSTRHTKKALGSFRVWKLFTLVLCSYLALNLVLVCWRPIGVNVNIETSKLQTIGTLNFIMSMIGTPVFGFLSDKIPFRILFTFVSAVTTLIGFVFCYTFDYPGIFMLLVCGMNFLLGGYIAVLPTHYMKVFGMKYYVEVGGVVGFANVIMGPICAFFAYFVENGVDDKIFAYRIIFITGAAMNIVSLILSIFESDDEFDYGF
jgi:MFS family permease